MKRISIILVFLLVVFNGFTYGQTTVKSIKNAECLFEEDCKNLHWNWKLVEDDWNVYKLGSITNAYKIYHKKGNLYVISTIELSSGTGEFTKLKLVEIENNKIKNVKYLAGGDRAERGIYEVNVKNDVIYFSFFITVSDFMNFKNKGKKRIYDDCFECYGAYVKCKFNILTEESEFLGIGLLGKIKDESNNFSKVYNSYIDKGKTFLKENEITEFINKVSNE